jgi:hypothetical protein
MSACFSKAGDARKYLSGQIVMRFVITASGQVSDVQVIKNGLGSYPVETCLVAEGKQIAFPAPEGRAATDFEYSMTFQSTGERSVIPWSGEEMARHLYGISTDLASCGAIGTADVDVIAYVEPGGTIGSVGFASEGSLDPTAADCTAALFSQGGQNQGAHQRCPHGRAFQRRVAGHVPHDLGTRTHSWAVQPQGGQATQAPLI